MVTRIGTQQRKTRHKFTKHYRQRGKTPLGRYLQEFKCGDIVHLAIYSSVQTGRFFPRFHGLSGTITGRQGACYAVKINDQGKEKTLYVHPIHLIKQ